MVAVWALVAPALRLVLFFYRRVLRRGCADSSVGNVLRFARSFRAWERVRETEASRRSFSSGQKLGLCVASVVALAHRLWFSFKQVNSKYRGRPSADDKIKTVEWAESS